MSSQEVAVRDQPARTTVVAPDRSAAVRRTARRIAHHERSKLALLTPAAILAALHGTAWIADVAHVHPLIRGAVIAGGAVAVLGVAERRGRELPAVAVAAGVLWMTAASIFGPYGWVAILLWIAGVASSVPFWVGVLRRPAPARTPQRESADPPSPPLAAQERLWNERVVPHNEAFKLTKLVDPQPVPDGYTAMIVGQPGPTKYSKMSSDLAVETVASANQVRIAQVAIEETEDGDASRARVTVIRSDANLQGAAWLEDSGAAIDPKTGIAQIGRYFDLQGAHRQFFTPTGGAQMGTVVGDTGSGKSGHGSTLLTLVHRCPLMAAALLDPQFGSSQPDWAGKTHIYGEGHEQVFDRLQMIDYAMVRRADHVAHVRWADDLGRERSGKPFLLPGDSDVDMEMLVVFVEELKFLLDGPFGKQSMEILGTAVRTWRKAGGSLIVFNQNLGLDNFGNSQSFRANLISGGSLAAFRTGSSSDHHMVGLAKDPSKLPEYFRNGEKTHGLGYLTGADRRPAASWRSMPVRDAFGIASSPEAGRLSDRTLGYMEEWRQQSARGRAPASASRPAAARRTSGDVQATVESVLAAGPMEVGAVCVAVRRRIGEVPLSEIPAALRTLTKAGAVRQSGDLYQLVNN